MHAFMEFALWFGARVDSLLALFFQVTVFILASLLPYLSPRADIGTQADSVPVAAAAVANPVAEAAATEVYVVTSA